MSSLYSTPLFYISFKPRPDLEEMYRSFGFKDVRHFQAIDGRKLSLNGLLKDNRLAIRGYRDIRFGRSEHAGLTTLGAVGCTMSHSAIWKMCVDNGWPRVIIAEEDNIMYRGWQTPDKGFLAKELADIETTLSQPNAVWLSTNINAEAVKPAINSDPVPPIGVPQEEMIENVAKGKTDLHYSFIGLHFYIPSFGACKALSEMVYPIDVQTDAYMAHLATLGYIHLDGYPISYQKVHPSSIQTYCVVCDLPRSPIPYAVLTMIFIALIVAIIVLVKRRRDD